MALLKENKYHNNKHPYNNHNTSRIFIEFIFLSVPLCGAALVSEQFAVTAMHCVPNEPEAYILRLGTNSDSGFDDHTVEIPLQQIFRHEVDIH